MYPKLGLLGSPVARGGDKKSEMRIIHRGYTLTVGRCVRRVDINDRIQSHSVHEE
jgi:hypothetical protein